MIGVGCVFRANAIEFREVSSGEQLAFENEKVFYNSSRNGE